jgi:hypothetical protein
MNLIRKLLDFALDRAIHKQKALCSAMLIPFLDERQSGADVYREKCRLRDRHDSDVCSQFADPIKFCFRIQEGLACFQDGIPDFNALHSRKHDNEVQLYAFDILALDGGLSPGLRPFPLGGNLHKQG